MVRKMVTPIVAAALVGCGGGADDDMTPAFDASEFSQEIDTSAMEPVALEREVFTYTGGGRDPFMSLVSSRDANLRPLPDDLRLYSIFYDAAYPTRSVAVVRDTTVNERYELRVNDQIGRMIVAEIRRDQIIFTVENFGVPEQYVLSLRRRDGQGGSK